jgi:hypothetical protein
MNNGLTAYQHISLPVGRISEYQPIRKPDKPEKLKKPNKPEKEQPHISAPAYPLAEYQNNSVSAKKLKGLGSKLNDES